MRVMFDSEERDATLIIITLVKFHVLVELSGAVCPLCRETSTHDAECPLALAWSFLNEEQQTAARTSLRALALSFGSVDDQTDTSVN